MNARKNPRNWFSTIRFPTTTKITPTIMRLMAFAILWRLKCARSGKSEGIRWWITLGFMSNKNPEARYSRATA